MSPHRRCHEHHHSRPPSKPRTRIEPTASPKTNTKTRQLQTTSYIRRHGSMGSSRSRLQPHPQAIVASRIISHRCNRVAKAKSQPLFYTVTTSAWTEQIKVEDEPYQKVPMKPSRKEHIQHKRRKEPHRNLQIWEGPESKHQRQISEIHPRWSTTTSRRRWELSLEEPKPKTSVQAAPVKEKQHTSETYATYPRWNRKPFQLHLTGCESSPQTLIHRERAEGTNDVTISFPKRTRDETDRGIETVGETPSTPHVYTGEIRRNYHREVCLKPMTSHLPC